MGQDSVSLDELQELVQRDLNFFKTHSLSLGTHADSKMLYIFVFIEENMFSLRKLSADMANWTLVGMEPV